MTALRSTLLFAAAALVLPAAFGSDAENPATDEKKPAAETKDTGEFEIIPSSDPRFKELPKEEPRTRGRNAPVHAGVPLGSQVPGAPGTAQTEPEADATSDDASQRRPHGDRTFVPNPPQESPGRQRAINRLLALNGPGLIIVTPNGTYGEPAPVNGTRTFVQGPGQYSPYGNVPTLNLPLQTVGIDITQTGGFTATSNPKVDTKYLQAPLPAFGTGANAGAGAGTYTPPQRRRR